MADAHGEINDDLIIKLSNLFDYLIIHSDQEYYDNKKILKISFKY